MAFPLPIRLIRLGLTGAVRTQSVYHAVARLAREETPDTVILTRPAGPYLCIGYHQAVDEVLDMDACRRRGLPVVRRELGGGTTYLDSRQLFYQFIFHHRRVPATPARIYRYFLLPALETLRGFGLPATLRDDNELEIHGRRVAGIGGGRIGESAVVVGNYLFDFDYAALAELWQSPWPAYRRLAAGALNDRIATLWQSAPGLQLSAVEAALAASLEQTLDRPVAPGVLTTDEERLADRLEGQLTGHDHLYRFTSLAGAPTPPLKIAAGLTIHAEQWQEEGAAWRGAFRVLDGMVEQALIERREAGAWQPVEHSLSGRPFDSWREEREPVHA